MLCPLSYQGNFWEFSHIRGFAFAPEQSRHNFEEIRPALRNASALFKRVRMEQWARWVLVEPRRLKVALS
jgi:hypothetical protein